MIEILSSILASDVLNMGADVRRMQEAGVDSLTWISWMRTLCPICPLVRQWCRR